MNTDFLSPIALAVEPFTLGPVGSEESPNPVQLLNPNRTAMLVDEFRFNVGTDEDEDQLSTTLVRLGLGATPLTNNFIPLRSFVPLYTGRQDRTVTWHLAQPMYVPPDVQLHVNFRRSVLGVALQEKFGFCIMGRSMPAGMAIPEKIYVPWACATQVLDRTVPFISSDADIGNPFDEVMNIDYFSGFNVDVDRQDASGFPAQIAAPLTMQATLSNGKVLMRDPVPFFALFPRDRPILRMRALLQPKEFISVVLDVPQPVAPLDTNAYYTTVGMTGWRELQTPLGALP